MTSGLESNSESRTETQGVEFPFLAAISWGRKGRTLRMTLTFEIELQFDREGFAGVDILNG